MDKNKLSIIRKDNPAVALCNNLVCKNGIPIPVQCGNIIKLSDARKYNWKCSICGQQDKEIWLPSSADTLFGMGVL